MTFRIYNTRSKQEVPFKTLNFSGGEVHVELDTQAIELGDRINIFADVKNSNDVMTFFMLLNAASNICTVEEIEIPYMPYGRQDRICSPGQAFGLRIFIDTIGEIFKSAVCPPEIITWDAHSNVTGKLCSYNDMLFRNIEAADFLKDIVSPELAIVAPDKGAVGRATKVAELTDSKVIYCTKERDPKTGKLSTPKIEGYCPEECDLLVVDDICDGGWTFINLGKMLRHNIRGKMSLYVTHGIFSRGFVDLLDIYDEIYTANSFIPSEQLPPSVKILKRPKGV